MSSPGQRQLHIPERRQVVLPFMKSVEIAVKSIRVRFLRSMITTLSLVLAISFYSYITINQAVARGVLASGERAAVEQLSAMGYEIADDGQGLGNNPKERWILFLSLLVCVVGIVNTQLMAVTERFREIGTMKCLGALDRFVLRLFLIEAGLQGILGASLGALVGALAALLASGIRFGFQALRHVSAGDIGVALALAVAIGCVLSVIGVLYPALVAARMQPVEAMRGKD